MSVERRAFLTDSVGVAATAGLPTAMRPLPQTSRTGAIGTAHIQELRAGLRSLYELDNAYGGGDVRSLAVRHLRRIRRVINNSNYPDTTGRQLRLLSGEAAEHCAWLFYDADDQEAARSYWGDALTTASMLGDASLETLVFAALSLQASHAGQPRDGLDYARAARERASRFDSPRLQSLLATREARALSLMPDAKAAQSKLSEAMRLAERTDRRSPDWTAFHGAAEISFAQGLAYAESGHHSAAVSFLKAALAQQNQRVYGRNKALYRLTLARSLVAAGQADEGAAHAVESLDYLSEVESGRVTRRIKQVAGLLRECGASGSKETAQHLLEHTGAKGC
ncbi:hypothetical protein AB0F42_24725 [Streptomyces buecherae]|uniref:hypothetical protein n=1 Tax=Streptomyces buecherae TaxID=2763006 RepID=UPI0033F64502